MLVVGDTSVGNTDEGPVDVGVGLSCNPPRANGSGHRHQAAALPPSEEERSSHEAAPGSELPFVLAESYPGDSRMFLGREHNVGRRERGSRQRESSVCLTSAEERGPRKKRGREGKRTRHV